MKNKLLYLTQYVYIHIDWLANVPKSWTNFEFIRPKTLYLIMQYKEYRQKQITFYSFTLK